MFVGHVADGDHCTLDGECGPTSRCPLVSPGVCPGARCEHVPQLGESCRSERCDLGLWCDATATCRALLALGDACDPRVYQFVCPGVTRCTSDGTGDPASGSCTPRTPATSGDPCGVAGTFYVYCDAGLVCDPTSTTCRAARTDGTCTLDAITPIVTRDCPLGSRCVVPSGTTDGACVPVCGGGPCPLLAANGATCTTDGQCESDHCASGLCADAPLCPTP